MKRVMTRKSASLNLLQEQQNYPTPDSLSNLPSMTEGGTGNLTTTLPPSRHEYLEQGNLNGSRSIHTIPNRTSQREENKPTTSRWGGSQAIAPITPKLFPEGDPATSPRLDELPASLPWVRIDAPYSEGVFAVCPCEPLGSLQAQLKVCHRVTGVNNQTPGTPTPQAGKNTPTPPSSQHLATKSLWSACENRRFREDDGRTGMTGGQRSGMSLQVGEALSGIARTERVGRSNYH